MSFMDTVKDFVSFGGNDYEEDEFEPEMEEEEQPEKPSFFSKKNKVVALEGASNKATIFVVRPKCFKDAYKASMQLKQRKPVILNVTELDVDEARRTVDFVTGTAFGIDGDIKKVDSGVFIITPVSYGIDGEVIEDKSSAGIDWSVFGN